LASYFQLLSTSEYTRAFDGLEENRLNQYKPTYTSFIHSTL